MMPEGRWLPASSCPGAHARAHRAASPKVIGDWVCVLMHPHFLQVTDTGGCHSTSLNTASKHCERQKPSHTKCSLQSKTKLSVSPAVGCHLDCRANQPGKHSTITTMSLFLPFVQLNASGKLSREQTLPINGPSTLPRLCPFPCSISGSCTGHREPDHCFDLIRPFGAALRDSITLRIGRASFHFDD